MNKPILTALFTLISFCVFAQISFDPGYFVNNEGKKIECLIRNHDRKANPARFEYQLAEGSPTSIATIDSVQEFEILNTAHKYQRCHVAMEHTSTDLKSLAEEKDVTFREEVLFLKVLVEGQGTLFSYYSGSGAEKYFFRVGDGKVEPLVSYSYLGEQNKLVENNSFRQQLWDHLRCPSSSREAFHRMLYKKNSLVEAVVAYNECQKATYINYSARKNKGTFHIALKAGVNAAAMEVEQIVTYHLSYGYDSYHIREQHTSKFDQKLSPVIGVDLEYVFPSYKNKWSMFFQPAFQYYRNKSEMMVYNNSPSPSFPGQLGGGKVEVTANYSHVTLPVGLRHYFFLDDGAKLFLNGALAWNVILNPSRVFTVERLSVYPEFKHKRIHTQPGLFVGAGYTLRNNLSVEAVYHIAKELQDNDDWKTRFVNPFSLVFGFPLK